MKSFTLNLFSLVLCSVLLFSCSPEEDGIFFAESDIEITASKVSYSDLETDILDLVNKHREKLNLANLSRLNIISSVADGHTDYMISTGKVNHDNFAERAQALTENANAKSVGENIAYGYGTAQGVVNGWLNSPEHKKIIEDPDYTHFGISTDADSDGRNYFTHIFIEQE